MQLTKILAQMGATISLALLVGCSGAGGPAFSPKAPEPGTALVYFYRVERSIGAVVKLHLSVNGTRVAMVTNGGYYDYSTPPGNVTFSTRLKMGAFSWFNSLIQGERELLTVNVQAGETKFVRFNVVGATAVLVPNSVGMEQIQGLRRFE